MAARSDITAELVRAILDYDHLTGIFIWKNRPEHLFNAGKKFPARHAMNKWNTRFAGKVTGHPHVDGFIFIKIFDMTFMAHRIAWLHYYGSAPTNLIDHINGDRSDNRIANLREATVQQNNCNKGIPSNSTSGIKGVSWNKARGKWTAQIGFNGTHKYLGIFSDKEDAAQAYRAACLELHGEFARVE
jgi:hypothetical protein